MCRPKLKERPPLRWEGEETPPDVKGPGFGQPMPKLEDRFPSKEVAKLRARQALEKK